MDIKEILDNDLIITMEQHPRKSCTLHRDCIICHPADKELLVAGLKGFFCARDRQKCSGKKFWFVPS